ncbi:hypothetical protein KM043_017840 [Ampulex compressa]|nr:hypothetical protein KM043_017840 [Ampulex compressa]
MAMEKRSHFCIHLRRDPSKKKNLMIQQHSKFRKHGAGKKQPPLHPSFRGLALFALFLPRRLAGYALPASVTRDAPYLLHRWHRRRCAQCIKPRSRLAHRSLGVSTRPALIQPEALKCNP